MKHIYTQNREYNINNATNLLWARQYLNIDNVVKRHLQSASTYIDRLEKEAELVGHEGCVNCLEWSSDGRLLASGSDDYHVYIWDPFRKRCVHSINTEHLGNMFSVKFLPGHKDAFIATAAADKSIYVYDINHRNETIFSCHCHSARVKRLATAPDSPHIFWSAGEDGNIMQLDIREQHRCRSEENRVQLICLTTYLDTAAEAKCIAVNPRRTEYIAVGCNDPYARIYDRRMLHPVSSYIGEHVFPNQLCPQSRSHLPKDCVTYYCPGHIKNNNRKVIQHESRAVTYLTFNSSGTELLVNMGCEHVYLYDLQNADQAIYLNLPKLSPQEDTTTTTDSLGSIIADEGERNEVASSAGDANTTTLPVVVNNSDTAATTSTNNNTVSPPKRRKLPEHIEAQKKYGNDYLENEKYLRAIEQYSDAISMWPDCAVLYLNRATAYMRRQWFGDVYAALRDCHHALRLEPSYIKAHFRLARALLELGRFQDADECLKELINRFPSYANNHGVLMLHKDIKENRRTTQPTPQSSENGTPDSQRDNAAAGGGTEDFNFLKVSDDEFAWRSLSKDYAKRFVGHCNTTTDIKEANYFGHDGNFIIAGSDDGNFFIWERKSGKIRAVYHGDSAIVNCVQPHPDICMLATSGIDHNVKIWSPMAPTPDDRPNRISYIDKCVESNQQKMRTDPFDLNTRNAYCWSG